MNALRQLLHLSALLLVLIFPYALFLRLCSVPFVMSYLAFSLLFLTLAKVQVHFNVKNLIQRHRVRGLNSEQRFVEAEVLSLCQKLSLKPPKVFVSSLNELSATVTGPFQGKMILILSEPLLKTLSRHEIKAIFSHELSHMALKDVEFVLLIQALIQVGAFPFSQILNLLNLKKDQDPYLFEFLLSFSSLLLGCALFRSREHAADQMSLNLVEKDALIQALRKLHLPKEEASLFSAHPSFQERVSFLKKSS